MSELLSLLDTLASVDVHGLPEPVLLVETEMLLDARSRLDGVIARHLQALDVREVTVSECGRSTRSWLVEEQHLSADEATRRMTVARTLPYRPSLGAALLAGDISHDAARIIAVCLRTLAPGWAEAAEAELLTTAREQPLGALVELCRVLRLRTGADENAEAAAQRRYESRWLRDPARLRRDAQHRRDARPGSRRHPAGGADAADREGR
jgi:hypothetical protein